MRSLLLFLFLVSAHNFLFAQDDIFPGADEQTPSNSEYFSWINNTNEAPTEEKTELNPEVYITAYPIPFEEKILKIEE